MAIPDAIQEGGNYAVVNNTGLAKSFDADGKTWVFEIRFGVAMVWLPEKLARYIIDRGFGCCGKPIYTARIATQSEVNQWKFGDPTKLVA